MSTVVNMNCRLLQRLHQMYVDRANKGEPTNLEDIKNKALASKPPFASSLAFMWQFAMKFSGGSKAPMMEETEAFVMNHAKAKHLGESVWRAMSEEHAAANKHLLTQWRHASVEDCLCPQSFQQGLACPSGGSQ